MDTLKRLDREHWLLFAVLIGAFGMHVGMLEGWEELAHPKSVGPLLVQLGAAVRLALKDSPSEALK